MSWIGGSISSLTGQLSNLTKDILTEGTEEIGDPATELRLAKEKIQQLDSILTAQKQENDRLKHINKELEEKAESSELQINTISREYRNVLESKEKEVNALKHQHQDLLEQHARSAALASSTTPSSSAAGQTSAHASHSWASPSTGGDDFSSFNYDGDTGDWDFDDSIRLQRENNNLRSELQRLQSEVKHWRSVAGQLGQNAGQDIDQQGTSADLLDLQHKVKSLEAQLAEKGDELQQQATSLHEHHRQKISTLKARHQAEISELKQQVSSLEQQLTDATDGSSNSQKSGSGILPESDRPDYSQREAELQRRLTEALHEKEKAQTARSHLEGVLEELQQEVERSQQNESQQEDVAALQRQITELSQTLQESEKSRLNLEKELHEVKGELVRTKYQLLDQLDANHVVEIHSQFDSFQADAQHVLSELRELRENMDTDAAYRREEMRSERQTLVNQLFRIGQQKNQVTKSLQSVKEEQEGLMGKTEETLEKIGDAEQQKATAELYDNLERENLVLREQSLKMEEQISLLEKAATTAASERQTLVQKITSLKSQLRNFTGDDESLSDDTLDTDLSSLALANSGPDSKKSILHIGQEEIDKEMASLRAQLSKQQDDLSGAEMERSNWLMEREALEDVITDLQQETQKQGDEIKSLKSGKSTISGFSSGSSMAGDSSDRIKVLEGEISSLNEEKNELENALEELDSQHSQALEQLIAQRNQLSSQLEESTMRIQQQQEQIEELNKTITVLKDSGGTSDEGSSTGESVKKQLEEKCKELESELALLKENKANSSSDGMKREIADLKEKLRKGGLVMNDLHMDKQELQEEVKRAKEETATKVAKLKEMREENGRLTKEKKELESKLLEMEDRLSDMEEEVEKWQQVNEEKQVQQIGAVKEHEECEKLKSQVKDMEIRLEEVLGQKKRLKSEIDEMEKEKKLFSANFEQLKAAEAVQFNDDSVFSSILEEEKKVRQQIEKDHEIIQNLKQETQKLYNDKQRLKLEVEELTNLKEDSTVKLTELKNNLEVCKAQLTASIEEKAKLQERISEAESKLKEAGKQHDELSNELLAIQREKSELENLLERQKKHYESYVEELKAGQELGEESLQAEHQKLLDSQLELGQEIDRLKVQLQEKAALEEALEREKRNEHDLELKADSFKKELDSVHNEISRLEGLCAKKDEEIGDLKARMSQFDKDLMEMEESIAESEEKHKHHLSAKEDELNQLKTRNTGLESSVKQLEMEMNTLLGEKQTMEKSYSLLCSQSQATADSHVAQLQQEIDRLKKERAGDADLHESISQLEEELTMCNETITNLRQELSKAQETIQCHEAGIIDLNDKTDEQRRNLEKAESDVMRQKSTIAVLRQTSVDKETMLSEIEAKLNYMLTILTPDQMEKMQNFSVNAAGLSAIGLQGVPAIQFSSQSNSSESIKVEESEENDQLQPLQASSLSSPTEKTDSEMNGYIVEDDFDSSTSDHDRFVALEKEMDDLRSRLQEKDAIVSELQKSNSSLLTLLEKGGGDKNLSSQVATHKLEAELRSLRGEREQMVAVVTEKSRENSSLKSEVHRLMGLVAAGQAAMEKLQEDNKSLEQRQRTPPRDDGEDDMRREALANMARLVRDRETEIEALKQKNETLLAVLQESGESQAASHLGPLLRDKETLMQQVAAMTSEREQLIACITQKHSESLAYHAEVQRFSGLLNEAQEARDKIKSEYDALIPAFQDKSEALFAAQNELVKCKQKLQDLEVRHGELIQRSNSQDSTKSPDLSSLEDKLEHHRNSESDLKNMLSQRDEKIHSLTVRVSSLEEELSAKENECAHLRKQAENSKFQLTGLMSEIADIKAEREQIEQKTSAQDSVSANLRESYNKMTLEVKEKDLEISSLKEQIATLTSVLHEQEGEQGQVTQLMKENETIAQTARQLQQERDQNAMIADQRLQETNALRNELSHLKDKEFKLQRELERLRGHLIEIEEGYTKEALESEEREKELRNRLALSEEQLMSSSSQVQMASQESSRHIESLEQQLQHVSSQRDSAYMQVANIQDQCQQYATSLSNLQLVLEHFQKEKDSAIASETERLQNQCKTLRIEKKEVEQELEATRSDLTEALDGLEAASRLSEQLDKKEEAITALKEEVQLREQALHEAEGEIQRLNSSTEAKVDKTLLHNMVMTWLTSPANKRSEIVHLIGNILSFSPEDFQKIDAAEGQGGLLSGIFRRSSGASTPSTPAKQAANQSFSQLFVKFLEKESSPPPSPVRLPAEAMAAEATHRHKPAFNPFMAPRHVTHDGQRAASPSSHLLMAHDTPAPTPFFTPLTSTNNSGESAILKDVLGKR